MDDSNDSDSYINEIELQPPSPDTTPHLDLYNADSYINGSPFSTHSDLSFGEGQLPSLFGDDPYDPADFDNPHSAQSLLMFDDPATTDFYEYYHSPSPSGSENNEDNSGVSSGSSAGPQFHSPNMMAQSFENMSFQSPNWGAEPLPLQKAPSPPRLVMPEAQPPIIINAPDDNTDLGPSLHIVPATPISGGGGVMNIASSRVQPRPWLEANPNSNNSSRSPSPSHSLAATPPIPSRSPSTSPQPSHATYLYAQHPRSRSKSDTSLAPPNWDNVVQAQGFLQDHPSQQAYQSPNAHPPTLGSNFTFGSSPPLPPNNNHTNNAYLSPEHAEFSIAAGGLLRRSKSDAGNAGLPRHRGSRSEDFRHAGPSGLASNTYLSPNSGHFLYPPTAHGDYVRSQQQLLQQNQRQDFLSGVSEMVSIAPSISHSPSLSPSMLPQPLGDTRTLPQGKHYRRASSGTRSERGVSAGVWEGEAVNNNRPSPYLTPNASPRGRLAKLAADRQDEFNFSAVGINGVGSPYGRQADNSKGSPSFDHEQATLATVSKPNVTTGRTANASQKRRKQDATFMCPIPGCGSTFTRSFNLKGGSFRTCFTGSHFNDLL